MSITLNPGSYTTISFQNMRKEEFYNASVTEQEIEEINEMADRSKIEGWSVLGAAFVVVRTDNWKDFAKDLFLPTFFTRTSKIESIRDAVFSTLALLFDLITLLPRACIAPFRFAYNASQEKVSNPLVEFIRSKVSENHKQLAEEAIQNGKITIFTRHQKIKITPPKDQNDFERVHETIQGKERLVVVKQLPERPHWTSNYDNGNTYIRINPQDEWVKEMYIPEGEAYFIGEGGNS